MTMKNPALRPADFRPPPNGDRPAMTQSGREWCDWVERGFMQLATAINRNTAQMDQMSKTVQDMSNAMVEYHYQKSHNRYQDAWEDITETETLDEAKEKARSLRERILEDRLRERKLKRLGALLAPLIAGLGAALWKLIESGLIK